MPRLMFEESEFFVKEYQPGVFGVYRRDTEWFSKRLATCSLESEAQFVCACMSVAAGMVVDDDGWLV